MMLKLYLSFFVCIQSSIILTFSINPKPLRSVYTPQSILEHKEQYQPLFIGDRTRYATCTGAAWFHDNYLAVLNLYGKKIITYAFNPIEQKFHILQEIDNKQGAQLFMAENLTVSPDGTLLVLCSDNSRAGISIYSIDLQTHIINPRPIFLLSDQSLIHNVRFTRHGQYLAAVGWDNVKSICIYKVSYATNKLTLKLISQKENNLLDMKPKGIIFTQDNRFAVTCYSSTAAFNKTKLDNLLVVYPFNELHGTLGNPVCIKHSSALASTEDIALLNNDHEIIVSSQGNDTLVLYPFNSQTGQIDDDYIVLKNPEAQLSFPHGMGVSQDGKYLVVTNYGDDKFNLYQIS